MDINTVVCIGLFIFLFAFAIIGSFISGIEKGRAGKGKDMLVASVNNMPKNPRRYVVVRVVENYLWYYMTFDLLEDAEKKAEETGEDAFVLEVVE